MKRITILLLVLMLTSSNTFTQTPVSGGIYSNTTWSVIGSPYLVIDDVVVFNGATLTIEPGVVIQFDDEKKLSIRGHLEALGNESDTVLFTSSSGNPTMGIWEGITVDLYNGGVAIFDFCEFQYAYFAIDIGWFGNGPGPVSISNSKFVYNERGIYGYANFTLNITNCLFENNNQAISSSYTHVENSKLVNNVYGSYTIGNISFDNCIICGHDVALYIGGGPVENCLIYNNNKGIKSYGTLGDINNNTIVYNDIGLEIAFELGDSNTICHNYTYNVKNINTFNVDITNNCWCTNDSAEIANTIYDGYDDVTLGLMNFIPFLICDSSAIPSSLIVACDIIASSDTICEGEEVVFTTLAENGGDSPLFEWYLNGELTSINDSIFTYSSFENGDEVYCVLTSSNDCALNNPATSDTINITVYSPIEFDINAIPNDTVCLPEIVTLDAGIVNASYLWSTGETTQQIIVENTSGSSGGLQSYWLTITNANDCQSTDSINIYFDPCLNLPENYPGFEVDVLPNPTFGEIKVKISGMVNSGYLSIRDLSGNLLRENKIVNGSKYVGKIDLKDDKAGVYIITLKTEDGLILFMDKIVKL